MDLRHHLSLELPFDEFRVWSQQVRPTLEAAGVEAECLSVLDYVCTEMLNNVLDHSGASSALLGFDWNDKLVAMRIDDPGRGIFANLRQQLSLESDADAALLVLKGKVTTDPARHTGEGLFFASRACEWFSLQSGNLVLSMKAASGQWLYDTPNETIVGTRLRFHVRRTHASALKALFDRFCPQPEQRFTKTEVSVALWQQTDGALVSRSQGKRLVSGLDRFTAVDFDFAGVDNMQQGFADEVFRVWAQAHPGIQIVLRSTNEAVAAMLRRVGFAAT